MWILYLSVMYNRSGGTKEIIQLTLLDNYVYQKIIKKVIILDEAFQYLLLVKKLSWPKIHTRILKSFVVNPSPMKFRKLWGVMKSYQMKIFSLIFRYINCEQPLLSLSSSESFQSIPIYHLILYFNTKRIFRFSLNITFC